jgi:hypothetical protein
LLVLAALSPAAHADERRLFDVKDLRARRYSVESSTDVVLPSGRQLTAVVLTCATPDGADKGLAKISRFFLLDGDRVEFDSFAWDQVHDSVEPGPNSRTFFNLTWEVPKLPKGSKSTPTLILKGLIPLQNPGEPIRTGNRVLILAFRGEHGFEALVDATSGRPAVVGTGEVRIPLGQ